MFTERAELVLTDSWWGRDSNSCAGAQVEKREKEREQEREREKKKTRRQTAPIPSGLSSPIPKTRNAFNQANRGKNCCRPKALQSPSKSSPIS